MNDILDTIKYKNHKINIYYDDNSESPREWDNLGTMLCFHKRHNIGDKHNLNSNNFNGWTEVHEYIRKDLKGRIILPLYLYDHSGLTIKIGSFQGLLPGGHAEFDSGVIGFIYITSEKIREVYSVKRINKKLLERVTRYLESEVETYDQYLSGQVYGYQVEGDFLEDSCWGFFGYEHDKNGLLESAQNAIDCKIKYKWKEHFKKLKNQIKNHVPLQYRIACPV